MGKKKKKIERVQSKRIKMDYYLRNYFLIDMEYNYDNLDLNNVNDKINEFENFLNNNKIKQKTHSRFIRWCNNLKNISKDLEEKNKNGEYEKVIRKFIKDYKETIDFQKKLKNDLEIRIKKIELQIEQLNKKSNLLKKVIRDQNFNLNKSKILKNKKSYDDILEIIKEKNIELNEILDQYSILDIEFRDLKKKVYAYDAYISLYSDRLNEFENRLYIINNQNIINNIANKVIPIGLDDISYGDIYSGLVIVVTDSENNKQAYVNPFRIDELNNRYLNMLGEDVRYLNKEKNYKFIREDDYNEKYKK